MKKVLFILIILGINISQGYSQKLQSSAYHEVRNELKNSQIKFERNKKGTVAFLGGSITHNGGWRDSVCNYLRQRFPETEFSFIFAGIPSMGSTSGAFRLQRDVLSRGPVDLLFEEAAVNDANSRTSAEQLLGMEGIVRHLRKANPSTDIVIMHFVDPPKMLDYRTGIVPEVIQNHNQVAVHYNISSIQLAKEVTDRIDQGEFNWKDDFKNLHPSPFGQGIYAHSIIEFLDNVWKDSLTLSDKVRPNAMPHFMNTYCYDNGKLMDIGKAKCGENWRIVQNWKPEDGKNTRNNYVNVPMLVGDYPGSSLLFRFRGNTVGISVAAGPDAGIIEYRIDKGEWHNLDLFTQWSHHLHLPRYYTLFNGLEKKKHILQVRMLDQKNEKSTGTFCRIRYFYVNE